MSREIQEYAGQFSVIFNRLEPWNPELIPQEVMTAGNIIFINGGRIRISGRRVLLFYPETNPIPFYWGADVVTILDGNNVEKWTLS